MSKGYTDLHVYNRAFEQAIKIYNFCKTLPKFEDYNLSSQMRRASMSICANIAEGHGKAHFSKAEFKRFLIIAAGSSQEMKVWIEFCIALEYIDNKHGMDWHTEYDEISKMINGLIRSL